MLRSLKRRRAPQLTYSAYSRCPCGAGLAYRIGDTAWDCSAILLGEAAPKDDPGSVKHTARMPFVFWEVKSERQPSANGRSTRPKS